MFCSVEVQVGLVLILCIQQAYTSDKFYCADGRCKPQSYVCDGDNDCGDWSDEQNCPKSCPERLDECEVPYNEHFRSIPGNSHQEFMNNFKDIPLEDHCRPLGELNQCRADIEEDCSSHYRWRTKEFAVMKVVHNFICDKHLDEFKENLDCIFSAQTIYDARDCAYSTPSPQGDCTEEVYAKFVENVTACIQEAFDIRINNCTDACTQASSDLIIDMMRETTRVIYPCSGSGSSTNTFQHALWKKNILGYFYFNRYSGKNV